MKKEEIVTTKKKTLDDALSKINASGKSYAEWQKEQFPVKAERKPKETTTGIDWKIYF